MPARPVVVERIVTERVAAGPDLAGPLAAVDRRARKALDAATAAAERAEAVAGEVAKARAAIEQIEQQEAVLLDELAREPTPESVAPPPAPVVIDAPTRAELAEQILAAVTPLAEKFDSLSTELRQRVTGLSRVADEAKSDANRAAAVAASAMSRDIPQPQPLPDFLVGGAIHNGHFVGVMQSGKTKDFGQVVFKPRVVSGGGRPSSQQMAAWENDVMLTYSEPTQPTVGAAAANIVAAGSAKFRRITIWVPNSADTGIHINPAGTATTSHFLLQPGASRSYDTNQAISAIRGGAVDVTPYVQIGTKT